VHLSPRDREGSGAAGADPAGTPMTDAVAIAGHCAPAFESVRETFASQFVREDEFRNLGAGIAVYVDGQCAVDLYAGHRDVYQVDPWTQQTLVNVWSASKGVMALAIAQLVDRGQLDYDAPVAKYWPQFAHNGKGAITVAQVVSHQAGLNGFAEPTTPQDLFDWELITSRLARQAPLWKPGAFVSYHGMTYGWLTGELIRRISGMEVRDYIRQQIAQPLGADLWLGVPDNRDADVAEIVPPEADRIVTQPNEIARWALVNPEPDASAPNRHAWRKAQIPAVNFHATADGLARIYAAIANSGSLHGVNIISSNGIRALAQMRTAGPDQMLGERHWASGMALNTTFMYGPDRTTFGHSGWGGSFGCANVGANIAIAYVVNRMGSQLNGDPRARALASAACAAAGRLSGRSAK
jgi:CubicO group peptidase (beta-lactamase class C family)